jgi:hypothetical protein
MSEEFQAKDGKQYREVNGCYYEVRTGADVHAQFNQGGRSVRAQMDRNPGYVDDTKQPEGKPLKGVQEGRDYGGPNGGNACDDPAYLAAHYPSHRGTDGEPIEHAGSSNHPLNNLHTPQPYTRQYTPEELPAKWAAEDAAAAEERS